MNPFSNATSLSDVISTEDTPASNPSLNASLQRPRHWIPESVSGKALGVGRIDIRLVHQGLALCVIGAQNSSRTASRRIHTSGIPSPSPSNSALIGKRAPARSLAGHRSRPPFVTIQISVTGGTLRFGRPPSRPPSGRFPTPVGSTFTTLRRVAFPTFCRIALTALRRVAFHLLSDRSHALRRVALTALRRVAFTALRQVAFPTFCRIALTAFVGSVPPPSVGSATHSS